MKKFYDCLYEFLLHGNVVSLYEVDSSKAKTLTIHVIHEDETCLKHEENEWHFWRAGLPTIRFINVNDVDLYPDKETIGFFSINESAKFPFNKETFAEDLWNALKKI